ncbi:MAG: hypothetical protein IJY80_06685 [Opitutales bacterium]|nr:hypothetical protein [Opitutales bacterium]
MSTAPVITVNTSLVEALLARTKKKVCPGILMSVVLEKAKRVVHDNFQNLNVLRNRYGSNFYGKWADDSAVTPVVLNGGSKGKLELIDEKGALRHKIYSGAVTPKRAKFLTIPISEQAKHQSARGSNAAHGEIPGLFLARGKNGRGLFLATENNGNLVVHYLLKKSVTHKPHPEVMPSTAEFAHAVQSACDEFAGGVTR